VRRTFALVLAAMMAVLLMGAASASAQDKVLVFSKTAAFRHDSIPQGIAAIEAIGAANNLTVDKTEDASAFTTANLAQYKAVIWLSTTGDVLNASQQTAFEGYIRAGGGYVGVHAAADTEYDWPWYGQLVGAWFKSHPATQQATVRVTDRVHPSTRDLPEVWTRTDEWYDYQRNPRADVHVLADLQESSYSGGTMGSDHPIAWCRQFDGGRTWYTGMGHTQESFSDPAFRSHLAGGILWAAGKVSGDCSVAPQPEPCDPGSDEFDGPTLDCRWSTIVRENRSAWSLSGGALRITTENGDLWDGGNNARNVFLQKAPSGGYELSTKVTIDSTGGSEQAGLVIYQDDDNYFKAGFIARDGRRWFEVVQELGRQTRHDGTLDEVQVPADFPSTVYLKLTQLEGTVTAYMSQDGTSWTPVGRTGTVSSFTAPKIGLLALTNDDAYVTTAAFDWFRVQAVGAGEDTTPPTIGATPDGLRTSGGQFLNYAEVTVNANDLGSGVKTVEYALGDGAFQAYSGPVRLTGAGQRTLRYRATDNAGNTSAIGSTTVTIATPPSCAAVTAEPGFKAVYDGTVQSLTDWSMAGPGGFDPNAAECGIDSWGGMGLLWYSRQPLQSPYTIRTEWRIYSDDDNSGVFIGFPEPRNDPWNPVAEGYEIQIDPTDDDPTRRTGSVYSFQAANAAALALAVKPHGQWNVMEVEVAGQLIVIRINGVEVNRYTSPHPERDPSSGYFGIQNDGAGADVTYRSVQVKGGGLEPDPTPTPTPTATPTATPTVTPTPTPTPGPTEQTSEITASVPNQLSLTLSTDMITFPPIVPGIAHDYDASLTALVSSSVRNTVLSVYDAGSGTGKLSNGASEFGSPVMVRATNAANPQRTFGALSGASHPLALLDYPNLANKDAVAIDVRQSVAATDALQSGRYSKAITFRLSAGTP